MQSLVQTQTPKTPEVTVSIMQLLNFLKFHHFFNPAFELTYLFFKHRRFLNFPEQQMVSCFSCITVHLLKGFKLLKNMLHQCKLWRVWISLWFFCSDCAAFMESSELNPMNCIMYRLYAHNANTMLLFLIKVQKKKRKRKKVPHRERLKPDNHHLFIY